MKKRKWRVPRKLKFFILHFSSFILPSKFQPFGEALFGAAHSNTYAQVYNTIHGGVSGSSNNNAFAMEFGGGLDYALTPHVQLRPVEVDYLYTRFGINGTSYTGNQNNFKYFAGVNFTFGGK